MKKLTDVLDENKIKYYEYTSPIGLALDVMVPYKGNIYKITVFCDGILENVRQFQIASQDPINPDLYYHRQLGLSLMNSVQRLFKWYIRDDGHYILRTWKLEGKTTEDFPKMMRQMIEKFLSAKI